MAEQIMKLLTVADGTALAALGALTEPTMVRVVSTGQLYMALGGAPVAMGGAVVGGQGAAIADLAAITGGETPTEAEHNLVVSKVNAIIAALEAAGVIASA